jgi:nucleotide-binding universal stress UspA family protein
MFSSYDDGSAASGFSEGWSSLLTTPGANLNAALPSPLQYHRVQLLAPSLEPSWILSRLSRLLLPEITELHYRLVLPPVEPTAFPATDEADLDEVRDLLTHQYRQLESCGFQHLKTGMVSASEYALSQLLKGLHQNPPDLLVLTMLNPHAPVDGWQFRLISQAPCSVLVLRPELERRSLEENPPVNIVLGVDGTEACHRAARQMVRLITGRMLEVSMVTVQNAFYVENPRLAPFISLTGVDTIQSQQAQTFFDGTRQILQAEGSAVRIGNVRRLIGFQAAELLHYADCHDPDLLVVGAGSHPYPGQWRLGSVASRLAQSARQSLLIAR